MANMPILVATTAAEASKGFLIRVEDVPVHFFAAPALGVGETATLQVGAGNNWVDYFVGGQLQQLTDTNSGFLVIGPGTYRINKSATAVPVGIYVASENLP